MFAPIEEIMHMIEDAFGGKGKQGEKKEDTDSNIDSTTNPFSQNTPQDKKNSETPALDFFGTDLTLEARNKKIDPIIGRDIEIDRLISILNRKTKNNPCLVGDPGVGKTAVVE
jgi:ATP-dependent Clp protease ATP-binding subunit ClpC